MLSSFFSDPLLIVIVLITVMVSMTLHEYAHAFVAYKNGDWTAKMEGRLTINPLRHIDPIGFAMLMVAGFGYAKPVPVNPLNFRHIRKGIFTTAIAGVTVNFILAFLTLGLAYLFFMVWYVDFLFSLFYYFAILNVSLIVFNLLPIYPLDGFRVVEAFTRHKNRFVQFMMKYGQYILMALILLSVLVDLFYEYGYNVPQWLDFLGYYIDIVRYYLFWPIDRLWMLIFNSPISIWQ